MEVSLGRFKLWISEKGLSWFRKGVISEISKSWSKSQAWQFSDSEDWLTVTRGRNTNGEFMKLSGPNSWGNTVDLYFPAGNDGEGWKQVVTIINQIDPIREVSPGKNTSSSTPTIVKNPSSVWSNPNSPIEKDAVNPIEKESWNQYLPVAFSRKTSWQEPR